MNETMKRLEEIESAFNLDGHHSEQIAMKWLCSELRRLQLPEDAVKVMDGVMERIGWAKEIVKHDYFDDKDIEEMLMDLESVLSLVAPALARVKGLEAENERLCGQIKTIEVLFRSNSIGDVEVMDRLEALAALKKSRDGK